jgi:ThiF family
MSDQERHVRAREERPIGAQHAAPSRDGHYARVIPIVGEGLRHARVALLGGDRAALFVEHLAACGVGHWVFPHPPSLSPTVGDRGLRERLVARHGAALDLDLQAVGREELHQTLAAGHVDCMIAVGDRAEMREACALLDGCDIPALLVAQLGPDLVGAWVHLAGDGTGAMRRWTAQIPHPLALSATLGEGGIQNDHAWDCAAPLLAGVARALLLRETPWRRADLEGLWAQGIRQAVLGGAHPYGVRWASADALDAQQPAADERIFRTPPVRRGCVLIAGLGSIGSVAAAQLAPYARQLILADPDHVDIYNPARQHYMLADIGRPKAEALAQRLGISGVLTIAAPIALQREEQIAELLERHAVSAALVATGTDADFAIARALRAAGVPHVVARCYPRARYWEAVLVDGLRGPSFEQVRGHLRVGPAAPPTAEQVAAYSDAGALEAEPATLVESGWAAAWAARLTHQLLTPPGLRERWMLELLAAEQICLVGGIGVEQTGAGPAYGVALPGQIHAWGLRQVLTRTPGR